jgi:hypothetical protein
MRFHVHNRHTQFQTFDSELAAQAWAKSSHLKFKLEVSPIQLFITESTITREPTQNWCIIKYMHSSVKRTDKHANQVLLKYWNDNPNHFEYFIQNFQNRFDQVQIGPNIIHGYDVIQLLNQCKHWNKATSNVT